MSLWKSIDKNSRWGGVELKGISKPLFATVFTLALASFFVVSVFSTSTSAISNPKVNVDLINGIAIHILDKNASSTITSLDLTLAASPSGSFTSDNFIAEVDTSNPTGYKLYMTSNYESPTSTIENPVYTNALVNLDNNDYTIPTLSTNTNKTDFASGSTSGTTDKAYTNKWGYSLDDTTYSPIPEHNVFTELKDTSTTTAHDRTPVYIAMNVDLGKASGIYKNTLVFSAVANPIPTNYTLSFNLNGGSAPSGSPNAFADMTAEEVAAQHTFTIPSVSPILTGYNFTYWTDSKGNQYDPGDTITIVGDELYTGEETLTANWEVATPAFYTITTMQEMTPEICNNAEVIAPSKTAFGTVGTNYIPIAPASDGISGSVEYSSRNTAEDGGKNVPMRKLIDYRGKNGTGTAASPVTSGSNVQYYLVAKLADGNCWMTEHLQLPLSTSATVEASYGTTTASSISTFSFTPSSNSSIGYTTHTPRTDGDTGTGSSGWKGYYYYNWYAATAEKGTTSTAANIDVNGSICPKGWRLPANYAYSNTLSWGALMAAYINYAGSDLGGDYTGTLEASPLSLTRSGYYSYGSLGDGGSNGRYWSSTASSTSDAYDLRYDSGGVYPQFVNNKSNVGFSVRCLAVR